MTSGVHQIIDRQIKQWEMAARARREEAAAEPARPARLHPWVTISRAFGSGGGEIARRLSARLGYQIFDKEIVDVLIQERPMLAAMPGLLDERDRSSLEVWVEGLLRGRLVDKADYLRMLVRVLVSIGIHGHAIIVGRGANFILDSENGLHVRIDSPQSRRIEAVSHAHSISRGEAERHVQQVDQERAAFIRRHFHREVDDPLGYDLVINTASIGPDAAVELIDRALREKLGVRGNVEF